MSSSRKRKLRVDSHSSHNPSTFISTERDISPDPALFIQAYEADIIRGPHATPAALSLEVSEVDSSSISSSKTSSRRIGDALIKWDGHRLGAQPAFPGDEDYDGAITNASDLTDDIWVDRYVHLG